MVRLNCLLQTGGPHKMGRDSDKKKILLVDVTAVYDTYDSTEARELSTKERAYVCVKPALEKAYQGGWQIYFWVDSDEKKQTFWVRLLQDTKLWELATPWEDQPLISTKKAQFKGLVLEHHLEYLMSDNDDLVIIERETQAKSRLSYPQITVLQAPLVWLNMVAVDLERLDDFLHSTKVGSEDSK